MTAPNTPPANQGTPALAVAPWATGDSAPATPPNPAYQLAGLQRQQPVPADVLNWLHRNANGALLDLLGLADSTGVKRISTPCPDWQAGTVVLGQFCANPNDGSQLTVWKVTTLGDGVSTAVPNFSSPFVDPSGTGPTWTKTTGLAALAAMLPASPLWAQQPYVLDAYVSNSSGQIYRCSTAGSGNAVTAPTGTGTTSADGAGYVWTFVTANPSLGVQDGDVMFVPDYGFYRFHASNELFGVNSPFVIGATFPSSGLGFAKWIAVDVSKIGNYLNAGGGSQAASLAALDSNNNLPMANVYQTAIPWAQGQVHVIGDQVQNAGHIYVALNSATSGSTAPTFMSGTGSDGTGGVTWKYVGAVPANTTALATTYAGKITPNQGATTAGGVPTQGGIPAIPSGQTTLDPTLLPGYSVMEIETWGSPNNTHDATVDWTLPGAYGSTSGSPFAATVWTEVSGNSNDPVLNFSNCAVGDVIEVEGYFYFNVNNTWSSQGATFARLSVYSSGGTLLQRGEPYPIDLTLGAGLQGVFLVQMQAQFTLNNAATSQKVVLELATQNAAQTIQLTQTGRLDGFRYRT